MQGLWSTTGSLRAEAAGPCTHRSHDVGLLLTGVHQLPIETWIPNQTGTASLRTPNCARLPSAQHSRMHWIMPGGHVDRPLISALHSSAPDSKQPLH
jgi:hypothetical protein